MISADGGTMYNGYLLPVKEYLKDMAYITSM